MTRRSLAKSLTKSLLLFPTFYSTTGLAQIHNALTGEKRAGPFIDNDDDGMLIELKEHSGGILEKSVFSGVDKDFGGLLHNVAVPRTFLPFEKVQAHLSEFLESKFDVFILVNSSAKGSKSDFVPHQHMHIYRRISDGPVFTRDSSKKLLGIGTAGEVWNQFPVSTGNGRGGIVTFSGIFRINHEWSRAKLNKNPEAPMSHQSYIDFSYGDRMSGVAIHGTPSGNHRFLGDSQRSHGCVRTLPKNAKEIRDLIFAPTMFEQNLPAFDKLSVLPNESVMSGNAGVKPGYKALIIIFDGFQNPSVEA